jgi:hypothetical protein
MPAQAICGVKFASLKKFANFLFENKVEYGKLHNRNTYVISISKEVYDRKKKEVERFEDEFFVSVKGV